MEILSLIAKDGQVPEIYVHDIEVKININIDNDIYSNINHLRNIVKNYDVIFNNEKQIDDILYYLDMDKKHLKIIASDNNIYNIYDILNYDYTKTMSTNYEVKQELIIKCNRITVEGAV